MSLVVIGANHRTASLELLERMSVRGDALPKLLAGLCSGEHTSEAVVLATCNRTEVYLVAERFHGAFGEVRNFFSDLTHLPPDRFADSLYVHYDDQAVDHLFGVVAGLDSAVPGEHEILGQVRSAWEIARREKAAGRGLNLLFRHALEVGKRTRSETRIGEHTTSVSQAAVAIATDRLGSLDGAAAAVVGAGTMGRRLARLLDRAGVSELVLANRTVQRCEGLASELGVDTRSVPLGELSDHLARMDVVFTATSAPHPVIGPDDAATGARIRPLLTIDLAVPRNVDPALGDLDAVDLVDMAAIAEITDAAVTLRRLEANGVHRIVDEEVQRYMAASCAREVAPLIAAVRDRAEEIRAAELRRFATAIGDLDAQQRDLLEGITRSMMAKLLHEPTVRLKDAAGSARGDRLAVSLAELFDL